MVFADSELFSLIFPSCFACQLVNLLDFEAENFEWHEPNIFLRISECFLVFFSLLEVFCDRWWVFGCLSFRTWLNNSELTSILFCESAEFS